jgi:tRNA pseudouridine(38-40) synthase
MITSLKLAPKRYLAIYSYIGTNYFGIRRDPNINTKYRGIAEVLEEGINMFNRKQDNLVPKVRTASRTDVGVHALYNAFTFDTTDNVNRKDYTPDTLKKGLNHFMQLNKQQIMIN